MIRRSTALALCVLFSIGCGADEDAPEDLAPVPDAVTVDTTSPLARAQYDANVAFLGRYVPRCALAEPPAGTRRRKRVLITGFGRFLDNPTNATGRMVSTLVPSAIYPVTAPPPLGSPDLPGPQTSVARTTLTLPTVGEVDVCAMILPVYWDLAAILALREIDAFGPDFVLMNGIASPEQDLWIELGSVNRAMTLRDGSDSLVPRPPPGQAYAPIVPSAPASELRRGLLLSWDAVRDAAVTAIHTQGATQHDGRRFDALLPGAKFGGFPRDGNTYLCNNVTYTINYAMAHPGATLTLLQASVARRGAVNRVAVRVRRDLRAVPRVFVHWPSSLAGEHLTAGAEVMRAIVDAQLAATTPPTLGDNARAELRPSGDTF